MTNAIEWLRNKAETYSVETMVVTEAEAAAAEFTPGTYRVTRARFAGNLPVRMALELRKSPALTNTDTEIETLRIGGQYRSEVGRCEYLRTKYEMVGA